MTITTNKKSLKSGLVFSVAVAGSILGNYHRAYSACAGQAINGGESFNCEGGDITINNSIDEADTGVDGVHIANIITLDGDVGTRDTNTVTITVGSNALDAVPITIQAENAAGVWFYNELMDGDQVAAREINEARNLVLNIGANVLIDTTSDGLSIPFGFKEAVSINNSSAHGSTTIVINGDVITRGVGENLDHAINLYQLGDGDTNVTVGETANIQAFDGGVVGGYSQGVGLNSYGLGKAIFNISGDISSEESEALVINRRNTNHNTDINLTVTSTSNITGASNAINLSVFNGNIEQNNITVTISGDVTSRDASALLINGSSRVGNQDTININSGAHLTGATSAIFVQDTSAIINLTGGTNFSSTDDADIVKLTGTAVNPTAISLPGSIAGGNPANNVVNISGNVEITGDITGGEDDGDADEINFNAANLTLSNSDVTQFENITVTDNSIISLTNNSSIVGGVVADAGKTLDLTLNASSLNGDGGNAVTFADADDNMTILGASAITGNVDAGDGIDTLNLSGATLTLNGGAAFSNFENLNISGANEVTETISFQGGDFALTVNQGASLSADATTINNDAYLISALSDVDNATISATINGSLSSSENGIAFEEGNANGNIISFTSGAGSSIQTDGNSVNLAKSSLANEGSLTANIAGEINSENGKALTIDARNFVSTVNITGQASISGDVAIEFQANSQANLTLGGTGAGVEIIGNSGRAISFSNEDDIMTINGIAAISGDVDGGDGTDTLNLDGATISFTNDDSELLNFEQINIEGDNVFNGRLDATNILLSNENASSLEFNGNLTVGVAPLTVSEGFYLAGNMTLNGNLEASGGLISPGAADNGIGEMTINGNVIFEAGSTLRIDINGNDSDRFNVTGTLDILDGANLLINPIGGVSGSATIMRVDGGINGAFSNVSSTTGNITLLYSNNNLDLNYVTLDTNVLSAQIQSSVDNSILFSDTLNKQISRGAFAKGRDFWIRNIYRNRDIDNSSSQIGFTDKSYGVAFGAENDFDDSIRYGFSAGYIDSNINIYNAQGGKDGSSYFAAAYANYKTTNNLFASLAMTIGYHDNDNSRAVTNSGVKSYAKSSSNDKEIGLNLQAGKKFTLKNVWSITPKFSASYIRTMAGSLKEDASAGNSAISVKSYEFSTLKLRESVRMERSDLFKFSQVEFSPYLELGLSQERSIGDRNISGTFSVNNQEFTAKLKNNNRSFVTAATGFNMKINKDVSAFVSYENAVSKDETRNDFNAGVNIKF